MDAGFAFVTRRIPMRGEVNPHRKMVEDLCHQGMVTERFYQVRELVWTVMGLTLMGQLVFPSLQPRLAVSLGAFPSAAAQPVQVGHGQVYALDSAARARGFQCGILGLLGPAKEAAG